MEIEKEIVREVALGELTPPEKLCRSKSTTQEGVSSAHRPDLCYTICRFSESGGVHQPSATSRHNLSFYSRKFLVLISFFEWRNRNIAVPVVVRFFTFSFSDSAVASLSIRVFWHVPWPFVFKQICRERKRETEKEREEDRD